MFKKSFSRCRDISDKCSTNVVRYFLLSREFPTSSFDRLSVCVCVRSTWILCLGTGHVSDKHWNCEVVAVPWCMVSWFSSTNFTPIDIIQIELSHRNIHIIECQDNHKLSRCRWSSLFCYFWQFRREYLCDAFSQWYTCQVIQVFRKSSEQRSKQRVESDSEFVYDLYIGWLV